MPLDYKKQKQKTTTNLSVFEITTKWVQYNNLLTWTLTCMLKARAAAVQLEVVVTRTY